MPQGSSAVRPTNDLYLYLIYSGYLRVNFLNNNLEVIALRFPLPAFWNVIFFFINGHSSNYEEIFYGFLPARKVGKH